MLLLLIMLLTSLAGAIATSAPAEPVVLAAVERNQKHGCIDPKGQVIVPVEYDDMGFWEEGLLAVNRGARKKDFLLRGGKWGFCNTRGQEVIPVHYDEAQGFSEGLAAVRAGRKWGFINRQGQLVIPAQFQAVRSFHNGVCPALNAQGKWGYLNPLGQWRIAPQYDDALPFDEGLARVYQRLGQSKYGEEEGKYGLINEQGKQVLPPTYLSIGAFHDGLAKVEVAAEAGSAYSRYGYINRQGVLVVPAVYDNAEDFSEGRAAVGLVDASAPKSFLGRNLLYGYIDETGRQVVVPQYNRATPFAGGYAVVERGNQAFLRFIVTDSTGQIQNREALPGAGLLDREGRRVLDSEYGHLSQIEDNLLLASRRSHTGTGVIKVTGEVVLPFEYVNLRYLGHDLFMDDMGSNNEEVVVVNRQNRQLFHRRDFAMPAGKYEYGVFHVRTDRLSKSGLVNLTGEWVVPPIYDMIFPFQEVKE